jgi:hypothetical protein
VDQLANTQPNDPYVLRIEKLRGCVKRVIKWHRTGQNLISFVPARRLGAACPSELCKRLFAAGRAATAIILLAQPFAEMSAIVWISWSSKPMRIAAKRRNRFTAV